MNTKAITCWADESEIINGKTRIWIVGQLIITCDKEFQFLQDLRDARKRTRTFNTMHAHEFTKHDDRKWDLLLEWLRVFKTENDCFYHAFVYKQDSWRGIHPSQHHYFAHQVCFGLGNKMRKTGLTITTLFSSVESIFFIMDRRALAIGAATDLETIYEDKMKKTLCRQSSRQASDLKLRFTFANTSCFDGLQLCDCFTSIIRNRYLHEEKIVGVRKDWLELWDEKFQTPTQQNLRDFRFDQKVNYFSSQAS